MRTSPIQAALLVLSIGGALATPGARAVQQDPQQCQITADNPNWARVTAYYPAGKRTVVDLSVQNAVNSIGKDRVRHFSYNGHRVGPVIRTRPGHTLVLNLSNNLSVDPTDIDPSPVLHVNPQVESPHGFHTTNLHTHGLHVSPSGTSDNVFLAFDPLVNNSATYTYNIPADHPAGTFWYHAHKHGSVAYQLTNGMAGALIVEGGLDDYAGLQGIEHEILVFQQITYRQFAGGLGRIFPQDIYTWFSLPNPPTGGSLPPRVSKTLINGQYVPVLRMRPREVRRFRMIHAGIQSSIFVHLDGHQFYEIALDGIPLKAVRTSDFVELEPGYRSDALVQASDQPGIYCLYNQVTNAAEALRGLAVPRTNLAIIVVEGEPVQGGPDITTPLFSQQLGAWATNYLEVEHTKLKDIDPKEITGYRSLTFQRDGLRPPGPNFWINGLTFDEGRIDQTIQQDAVEEWTLQSISDTHPFHIHVNPFQVQEKYPDGSLKWVWRDTVLVKAGQTVTIRSRFPDFTGKTVLHCHNVDHEDQGMMEAIQIVPPGGGVPNASPKPPTKVTARGLPSLPALAPQWVLMDAEKRQVRSEQFKGRNLLMVLHRGLECMHCAEQIVALARSAARFDDLGVQIAAVSPQWPEPRAVIAARQQLQLSFPLLADPTLEVFKRYGCLDNVPLHGLFLIDATGSVRWQKVGDQPETDMVRLLEVVRRMLPSPGNRNEATGASGDRRASVKSASTLSQRD
jgi:FtsP/CotA-like multicopper oxidase with cupredoxin domain/peroxiredoxin